MTIAERNAERYPELANSSKSTILIEAWAKDVTIAAHCTDYVDYPHAHQHTTWDVSDETDALIPSETSYTPLLEKRN